MNYNLEMIINKHNNDENVEFIFFWGHRQNKKDIVTKSCFSQWYISDFVVDGTLYNCAEKYMMAEKARLFKDDETLEEVLKATEQGKIKALGRKIKNFNEEIWNKEKYNIVLQGNLAKFTQNEKLKEFLINTENKIIVEASPYDKVWGVGLLADDEKINNPNQWAGENLLGFALMEVRDLIK